MSQNTNCVKIQELDINFPFKPYETQIDQMNFIIGKLNESQAIQKNLLIESPSGTGKTLTQICSILTWMEAQKQTTQQNTKQIIYVCQNYNQMDRVVEEINKSQYRPNVLIRKSDYRYFSEEKVNKEIKKDQISQIEQILQNLDIQEISNKLLFVGEDKNIANFSEFEKNCKNFEIKESKEIVNFHPYLVSQILQNSVDIIITVSKFFFDDKFFLGKNNDKNFKLENKIIIFDQGHDLSGVCEEMGGITFNNQETKIILKLLEEGAEGSALIIGEIQALKEQIENQNVEIQEIRKIDIFFYELFLNNYKEKAIKQMGLQDSVKKVKDKYIRKYFEEYLMLQDDIYNILEQYYYKFKELKNIQDLQDNEKYFVNKQKQEGNENLIKMNINCMTPSKMFQKIQQLKPKCIIISSCSITPFYILQNSLELQNCEQFQGSYMTDPKKQLFGALIMNQFENSEDKYNFSHKKMEEDERNYMAIDLGRYIKKLVYEIPNGCIVSFSNKSNLEIINKIWFQNGIITYDMEKKCQVLGNKQLIYDREIGKGLFNLNCNKCDQLMGKIENDSQINLEAQENNQKCQICNRIKVQFQIQCADHKTQMICQQCASLDENVLDEYQQKSRSKDGAIMLTVCKSKNFYDQNFEGELLRGLFMVGLPFFQYNDIVQEKIQYNCVIKNNNDWYKQQMYRLINSTIGRVIRNQDDWGSIYLFDNRFAQYQCEFPKFFRDTYKNYQTTGKLFDDTQSFFESHGYKKPLLFSNSTQKIQQNQNDIFTIQKNYRQDEILPAKFVKSNDAQAIKNNNEQQSLQSTKLKNQDKLVYQVQLFIVQNQNSGEFKYKYLIFDYIKKSKIKIQEDTLPNTNESLQLSIGHILKKISLEIKLMENQPYKIMFEIQDGKFVQIGCDKIIDKKIMSQIIQIKQILKNINVQFIWNSNLNQILQM